MDWLLLILGLLLMPLGVAGCVLPVLPGPPLCFAGLLLVHFTRFAEFSESLLFTAGGLVVAMQIIDTYTPAWGAKKYGGTKRGEVGSILGLLAGLFLLPPLGPFGLVTVIGGPFLGAYVAELTGEAGHAKALSSAFGTFVGFIAGTLLRVILSIAIAVATVIGIFRT
ncbi:MAG: DUF456 domain-containing protein [bacterium]|nr:DUF456 domain-containing protein [bacterium]